MLNINFFFLISKKISLKKRKAPLSTQGVYTGATQLAHMKNPRDVVLSVSIFILLVFLHQTNMVIFLSSIFFKWIKYRFLLTCSNLQKRERDSPDLKIGKSNICVYSATNASGPFVYSS